MKVFAGLLVASLAVVAASAGLSQEEHHLQKEFNTFTRQYGKVYSDIHERNKRFAIFKDNFQRIKEHNLSQKSSYSMGVTKFADLTQEEYVATLNGRVNLLRPGSDAALPSAGRLSDSDRARLAQLPESMDWRDMGIITPIKDQGSCGSCWAMVGVELVESYAAMNNGTQTELSLQQMNACTPNELNCGGSGGCQGSITELGFLYTELYGLTSEEEYPYTSGTQGITGQCTFNPDDTPARAFIRGFEVLPRNDYVSVMEHIANKGPLAVSVDAGSWSFYRGGVFDGCDYAQNIMINHAVELIGYGTTDEGEDYWLIRNAWGTGWGEEGFMKIKRESETQCGVDKTPLFGIACENDGQTEQHVCGMCAILFDTTYPIGAYLT